jgi:hypothetical protein
LDQANVDLDDELRMLSRQLLWAREIITVIQPTVKGYAYEYRVGNNQKIAQWVETYLHGEEQGPDDQQRWEMWADENNIRRTCGSSRDVCGGVEEHG